jgi:hypothetical protein
LSFGVTIDVANVNGNGNGAPIRTERTPSAMKFNAEALAYM